MLGVVDAGQVDGVLVASLDSFSPDLITQEIAMWDLRRRGATVVTADADEIDALASPSTDPSRDLVREMLSRLDSYRSKLGKMAPPFAVEALAPEITIELVDPKLSSSGA